jgi:hypothetical protein
MDVLEHTIPYQKDIPDFDSLKLQLQSKQTINSNRLKRRTKTRYCDYRTTFHHGRNHPLNTQIFR